MKEVTKQEVLNIITGLNSSSSTGVDYIDVGTIKLVKHEIAEALQTIINLSIQTSTFLKLYKQSKIIPLKKKPGLYDLECSSYRPVNLSLSLER